MDLNEAGKRWAIVHKAWKDTNEKAKQSRAECTLALLLRLRSRGPGPSNGQLAEADRLERFADQIQLEEEALLHKVFD